MTPEIVSIGIGQLAIGLVFILAAGITSLYHALKQLHDGGGDSVYSRHDDRADSGRIRSTAGHSLSDYRHGHAGGLDGHRVPGCRLSCEKTLLRPGRALAIAAKKFLIYGSSSPQRRKGR